MKEKEIEASKLLNELSIAGVTIAAALDLAQRKLAECNAMLQRLEGILRGESR